MRFAAVCAALAAFAFQVQPAEAVTFEISGVATGTISGTEVCDTGYCTVSEPFTLPFFLNTNNAATASIVGDLYNFTFGPSSNAGTYGVQFRGLGFGVFQSIYMNYNQVLNGCLPLGTPACARDASTTNFSVRQTDPAPLPEPTTWAMMMVGFAVIGGAMRRRTQVALATSL